MSLVDTGTVPVFNLKEIKPGDCIYAKHQSWNEGHTGYVSSVSEDKIVGNFYPGIAEIVNHFIILVSEAAAGEWTVRWSEDLVAIHEYPEPEVRDEP